MATFERILWRATRGNLFMRQTELQETLTDPTTGEAVNKNIFVIFFQGERLQRKITKVGYVGMRDAFF